jgi:hypothetical protein
MFVVEDVEMRSLIDYLTTLSASALCSADPCSVISAPQVTPA